jgi:hypothetical protein
LSSPKPHECLSHAGLHAIVANKIDEARPDRGVVGEVDCVEEGDRTGADALCEVVAAAVKEPQHRGFKHGTSSGCC